jgi:hypothetical protein
MLAVRLLAWAVWGSLPGLLDRMRAAGLRCGWRALDEACWLLLDVLEK